jgi:hypothetical protein
VQALAKPVATAKRAKAAAKPETAPALAGKPRKWAAKTVVEPAAEVEAPVPKRTGKKAAKAAAKPAPAVPAGPKPCAATTQSGAPCKNAAKPGSRFCARHA